MAAVKLTQRLIDAFAYEGVIYERGKASRDVRWDTAAQGLGVRIYPSGKKAFVFRYGLAGRKRIMVLGLVGVQMTLEQARKKARASWSLVSEGVDPQERRRRERVRGRTLRELLAAYVADRRSHGKKTWARDGRRFELCLPERLKGRAVSSITRTDIEAVHKALSHVPYEANRVVETLRHAFRLGRRWGYLEETAPNPAAEIDRYPETKRKVWVTPAELPVLVRAVDAEASIYIRGAVWLYMLTGARRNELLEARRHDVDREMGRLRLPDTKSGEEQFLTLSSHALAVIDTLPGETGNPFLFPGAKRGQHLVNISKPWGRIRERATMEVWQNDPGGAAVIAEERARLARTPKKKHARARTEPTIAEVLKGARSKGLELPRGFLHVRLHDLRRTTGSWLTAAGADLNLIKEGLRHQSISTTLTYARLAQDAARPALEDYGRRLKEAAGRKGPVVVGQPFGA